MLSLTLLLVNLLLLPVALLAQPVDLEEQVRRIAAELRCPVCQNLSVSDSPSEMAQQMRGVILQQLKDGKSPEQIKAYFVSKYGDWVLLSPRPTGFGILLWILPFVALTGGIVLVVFAVRRWVKTKPQPTPAEAEVDPALVQRVQRDVATDKVWEVGADVEGPRALLMGEQAKLYTELQDLEFDYQAGRLSDTDYRGLRQRYEAQATSVLKELDASPAWTVSETRPFTREPTARNAHATGPGRVPRRRGWVFAATGVFLLLFGVTLGVFLGRSLRPRGSSEESITGDFLTGTGLGGLSASSAVEGKDLESLLSQAHAAFERQEWSQAIDAFKKVLAIDPDHPEAHTYMGLILARAGHTDGALMAFDKALSTNANFPLALWGKGMVLYRAKGDLSGARQHLEKVLGLVSSGAEKNAIQRTIDELRSRQATSGKPEQSVAVANRIGGTISIDPKLKAKVDAAAVLFIIVRSPNAQGGPPLGVKKVIRPVFPLSYSLGPEDTMIPGTPFSGKVNVSARLDRDGNPMTREPGSLFGQYKKNPIEIGSQEVDVIMDQVS